MTAENKPTEDRTFSHIIWNTETDRFVVRINLTEDEAMKLAELWGGLVGNMEEVEDDGGREGWQLK